MVKNYMEVLVDEIFREVTSSYNLCNSDSCQHNIKSIALNNLPTTYFNFDISEAEKKAFLLNRQRRISVLAKVAEATDLVCGNCPNYKK